MQKNGILALPLTNLIGILAGGGYIIAQEFLKARRKLVLRMRATAPQSDEDLSQSSDTRGTERLPMR